jgi:hypothetical protein
MGSDKGINMTSPKKDFKKIVQEIQKIAAPPPPPPTGYSATSYHPGTTAPAGHAGGGVVGDPTVKAMQQELINLGQAVTQQIHLEGLTGDKRQQQEAVGRDSFGDFITKNYLRNSDVPGVEFNPDPTKQNLNQKKPSDPTRLSVVMDTMKRIGNPKGGELTADGSWGPRTNAALHNAYAFAFAMLNLARDFNLPVKSYTESNLEGLKNEVPEDANDINAAEKAELAPRIAKHLRAIQRMYKEIKDGILEKPAYRAFIESDKPFVTYKKQAPKLTEAQLAGLSQAFANGFQVRSKDKAAVINVKDLVSMDALKKWQQQNLPELPLQMIIAQLRQQVHPAANQ